MTTFLLILFGIMAVNCQEFIYLEAESRLALTVKGNYVVGEAVSGRPNQYMLMPFPYENYYPFRTVDGRYLKAKGTSLSASRTFNGGSDQLFAYEPLPEYEYMNGYLRASNGLVVQAPEQHGGCVVLAEVGATNRQLWIQVQH